MFKRKKKKKADEEEKEIVEEQENTDGEVDKEKEKLKEQVEEMRMMQQIRQARDMLKSTSQYRYLLLNNLTAVQESLNKIGQALVKLGEVLDNNEEEEDAE